MNVEKTLKDSINIEKEAYAATEALQGLSKRKDAAALAVEYAQDLENMEQAAAKAKAMINALPDESLRRIFALRYQQKMTWEQAADEMFLSVTHVQRLHRKGIKWLEDNHDKLQPPS